MAMKKAVLAIAIEDRVDLCFQYDNEKENVELSKEIPEGGNYIEAVRKLLEELLEELWKSQRPIDASELFNSIVSVAVSVPGVVKDRRTLLQIPLWHSPTQQTLRWKHKGREKEYFDFAHELGEIAQALIEANGQTWSPINRRQFESVVVVFNDATACAAFEFKKRQDAGGAKEGVANFAYIKLYQGINVGWVEQRFQVAGVFLEPIHSEAGHGYPIPHELDHELGYTANFHGVCHFHTSCIEGLIATHGFHKRALHSDKVQARHRRGILKSWRRELDSLKKKGFSGQKLDDALLRFVLDRDPKMTRNGRRLGVDIIAHYASQLIHQLSISPWAPKQIVVGGQMVVPPVIKALRENLVHLTRGYPQRPELLKKGVSTYIVSSRATKREQATVELRGALSLARSHARLSPSLNSESENVTPLRHRQ